MPVEKAESISKVPTEGVIFEDGKKEEQNDTRRMEERKKAMPKGGGE